MRHTTIVSPFWGLAHEFLHAGPAFGFFTSGGHIGVEVPGLDPAAHVGCGCVTASNASWGPVENAPDGATLARIGGARQVLLHTIQEHWI